MSERLATLRSLRESGSNPLEEVREIVLVLSSSRGGSSVFSEVLRGLPGLIHLRAEINPFLHVAGMGWPHSGEEDDRLTPESAGDRQVLARELSAEIGVPARDMPIDELATDLAWRLAVQWPDLDIRLEQVRDWTARVALEVSPSEDIGGFHLGMLACARERFPAINPYFYDLDQKRIAREFPDLAVPQGPPGQTLIEEPPFVAIVPWRKATREELATCPLVIKTPSNAYRVEFYRSIFPNARIRFLHLVRNPAASINGLYDGWRYHGFHSQRMAEPLELPGYSDHRPLDAMWWKYDLPPGWREVARTSLVEVCALQWSSTHRTVLDTVGGDPDLLRLRFEDFIGGPAGRLAVMRRMADWLDIQLTPADESRLVGPLAQVMSTARPRMGRWYNRAELLDSVLNRPALRELAAELGYEDRDGWI